MPEWLLKSPEALQSCLITARQRGRSCTDEMLASHAPSSQSLHLHTDSEGILAQQGHIALLPPSPQSPESSKLRLLTV
ncbi:Protein NOV [Clarias magur]|uniref:Protein NOV n=1 Tax=Clarias magur TaxID=1594786 RepID=A0A8J4TP83_CLAMG|nr:Protein NOV [Clarias magur]